MELTTVKWRDGLREKQTVTSSNTKMHNKISITPISLIIIHLLISILFFKFFRSKTKDFLQKKRLDNLNLLNSNNKIKYFSISNLYNNYLLEKKYVHT